MLIIMHFGFLMHFAAWKADIAGHECLVRMRMVAEHLKDMAVDFVPNLEWKDPEGW